MIYTIKCCESCNEKKDYKQILSDTPPHSNGQYRKLI